VSVVCPFPVLVFDVTAYLVRFSRVLCGSVSPAEHKENIDDEVDDDSDIDEECNNYDISDLCSDDSTDDELEPKKKLPTWADGQ